jgi:hypothetical protein
MKNIAKEYPCLFMQSLKYTKWKEAKIGELLTGSTPMYPTNVSSEAK